MFPVELAFQGDLVGFLPKRLRGVLLVRRELNEKTTSKDLIEACGVPHPEVDLIVDAGRGEAVGFDHPVSGPVRLEVYPVPAPGELLPGAPRLQRHGQTRFVADVHLAALARHLRLLGLDTTCEPDAEDARLLEIMTGEIRVLLTRDRRLLMHSVVRDGYCPRSDDPEEQAREVLRRFRPAALDPSSRCLSCNGLLFEVPKSEVLDELADQPRTLRYYDTFFRCGSCGRIYWRGSHYAKLGERLGRLAEAFHGDAVGGITGSGGRGRNSASGER